MKRLYRHAQIASEDSPKLQTADVLVEGDKIIGLAPSIEKADGAEIIDCMGRVLMPSLFDIHVHAREPGQEEKENIATCAEAAINGGVTGFIMMPNTAPAIDNAGVVRSVLESARRSRIGAGSRAPNSTSRWSSRCAWPTTSRPARARRRAAAPPP
jgi:dihydroorotase